MAMDSKRLKSLAALAAGLAENAKLEYLQVEHVALFTEKLRNLLEDISPGGTLDPILDGALADKELATLNGDVLWLRHRFLSPSPHGRFQYTELPIMRDRLVSVAKALNQAGAEMERRTASVVATPPTAPAAQITHTIPWTNAQRVGNWILLDEKLGRGGQGEVTLVRHAMTFERGALKRMAGHRALTEKGRERFMREIDAFRKVHHPFVLGVLDAARSPEPYLVTEIAAFGSLHDNRVAFHGDVWRCLRLVRSLALGLAAAHEQGIVHRDIKPKNILIQSLDHPLVADFGIAHFADKDTVTSLGENPGAFNFAPPEYEFEDDPTPAFDVFSLGAVLHFALTGAEP